MPEVAVHGAQRLSQLGGDAAIARDWLLPAWDAWGTLGDSLKTRLQPPLAGMATSYSTSLFGLSGWHEHGFVVLQPGLASSRY